MEFNWKLAQRVFEEYGCYIAYHSEIGGCRLDFYDSLPSQTHSVLKILPEMPPVRALTINLSNANADTCNALHNFTDLVEYSAHVEKPASIELAKEWNKLLMLQISGSSNGEQAPISVDIEGGNNLLSLKRILLIHVDIGVSGYAWIGRQLQLEELTLIRVPLNLLTLKLDSLKVVTLNFTTISNEISCLADCDALIKLDCQGSTFQCDPDSMFFIPHSKIEELNLSHTNIDDSRLSAISESGNIKILSLSGTKVSPVGIKHLISLTSLSEVSLDAAMLNAESICYLAECNTLDKLWISDVEGLKNKSFAEATVKSLREAGQWCMIEFIGPAFE